MSPYYHAVANDLGKMTGHSRAYTLRCALLCGLWSVLATAAAPAPVALHRGNVSEPETLDPQKVFADATGLITLDMFVGLVTYDAAANPSPGMAQSWAVSPDGLTYTFKLRPKVAWSDGSPVTAEEIALGVTRALDPKTAAPLANLAFCIKNAVAVNAGRMPVGKLGVRVVDAATIEIKVEAPCPTLITALAEPPFTPAPIKVLKKYGNGWTKPGNIVSNGPFKFADWRSGDHLRVVKNPLFYDAANVNIDEVVYYPIEDDHAALLRFRAGDIDLNARISPNDMPWLKKNMAEVVHSQPTAELNYVVFDHSLAKFKDIRVRRALALAVDQNTLATKLMALGERPAYGLVPPVSPAYHGPRLDFSAQPLAQRQAEARRLLAEAGYTPEKPLSFVIRQRAGSANKRVAIGLQSMWAQVGVKVALQLTDIKTHFAELNAHDFEVGVTDFAWPADPEYFLADLMPTSPTNNGRYVSAAYAAKMREAQAQVKLADRYALFAEAEGILLNDVAIVPLFFNVSRNIVATRVKGFVDNPRDFHLSRFLRLEPMIRAQ